MRWIFGGKFDLGFGVSLSRKVSHKYFQFSLTNHTYLVSYYIMTQRVIFEFSYSLEFVIVCTDLIKTCNTSSISV